jgi:hypothetical protein
MGVSVPLALWNWRTFSWWARASLGIASTLFFVVLGIRMLLYLSSEWQWLALALIGYLVALGMPVASPSLSQVVWRELVTPTTKIGRALMVVAIGVLPIAGVLGASIGLHARGLGNLRAAMGIGAFLALSGSMVWAFSISHQFWPERPWRVHRNKGRP